MKQRTEIKRGRRFKRMNSAKDERRKRNKKRKRRKAAKQAETTTQESRRDTGNERRMGEQRGGEREWLV